MSFDASELRSATPNALPAGTRLGEFELLSLLGVGGFGIVYLAFDHALEREVAIKEYMPASLAGRTETMHVTLRSQSDAESFALGLKSFVNEAKLLARFDHPSLLKVHRFWEANGTAYMAMPVMRGRTVKDVRLGMAGPPDEAWCRHILLPLLGAIERLHSQGVYHRDIAPDNIQIEPDGRPVLLDFGAARRVLTDKTQTLTAILKPAYAPIEQYGEAGAVRQGPWTDIYALGATLHYLLLGRPPSPATARTVHDDASNLTPEQLPGCGQAFLHTIDWMLCPRPADRPQSVAELRDVLEGRARLPMRRAVESAPVHWERTSTLPHPGADARVDLDVGEGATQYIAPPSTPRPPAPAPTPSEPSVTEQSVTEHVWLEPEHVRATLRRTGARVDIEPGAEPASPMTAERVSAFDTPGMARPPKRSLPVPLVLAAVAAAAVAAAVALWPFHGPEPAQAAPSPAARPGAVATPAPEPTSAQSLPAAPAPDAVAAPASAAVSEPTGQSAAPSVVMPPSEPVRTVELPATKPPASRTNPPQKAPAATRPAAEPSRPRTEPAVPVPDPATAGPGPSCGPRAGVRYHVCMERECGSAEFSGHPACQAWKQEAR